jgi:predicted nucleotidyltransferase
MLNPDYAEMLSIFTDHEVAFLMVGAYAMAGHGFPRATGDMDLWVEPTPENAARVYDALVEFGAPSDHFTKEDFGIAGTLLQIGVEPRRIDIITAIDGVVFAEAWNNREEVELDGVVFPVLSMADLITNKRATGRKQDALDAEWLEAGGR